MTINKLLGAFTETEIEGQPKLWREVFELVLNKKEELNTFLYPLLQREHLQIILTGAGSSAFVGEAAEGLVQKNTSCSTKAIATTDIVTHPELSFQAKVPTLLVSFARSGNSPESLEAIKLADDFCDEVYHLIISCNKDGELVSYTNRNRQRYYPFLLPEASNDKSLAMTGSFTSMLLAILLLSDLQNIEKKEEGMERIVNQGNLLLENAKAFKTIAAKDFERVVFLGSGPMLGIAWECHLKLQELTDGQIICKHDSFLGFRHGPRAVINERTLLVYLFSADDHVYKFELDLALSIAKDQRNIDCLSIGRVENADLKSCLNVNLKLNEDQELNIVPTGMVGQILGYYKSIDKGLDPDNPSVFGAINRVVQGVIIYDNPKKRCK